MADVTQILSQIESGDPAAAEQLLPLVYDELRKLAAARLAQEKPGQTLQATALVHEAYMRLVGNPEGQNWNNRAHFFGAAAEAMRRILINIARGKDAAKRNGDRQQITLDALAIPGGVDPAEVIAINDLFEELVRLDPQASEIAKLRIYAGLTVSDTAAALNLSVSTVERHWVVARAWLRSQFRPENAENE